MAKHGFVETMWPSGLASGCARLPDVGSDLAALHEVMRARFTPDRLCSPRVWGGPGCPQHGFSWIGAFRARLGRQMLSPRIV